MNRTSVFLATATVLSLIALVVGVPRLASTPTKHAAQTPRPPLTPPAAPTVSDGSLSLRARLSHPFIALGRQDAFLTVEVEGAKVADATRAAVNFALVIDRSGSMSGFKLNQAKQAARQLVAQLTPQDRLAIVHYGSDVRSLDGQVATPENKERMLAFIDGIWDDGGTNIGAGLAAGRDALAKAMSHDTVNRLVLVSDGQPTEGLTDHGALTGVVRELRAMGISVSSLGVGEDFNEHLMAAIAEVGAGAYGYLQDASQLAQVFQRDLAAAGTQVARGVTVTFRVPPGVSLERVLGYSQVTRSADGDGELVTVALPDFSSGQRERLVAQLLVEGVADGQAVEVAQVEVVYRDTLREVPVRSAARLSAMTTANTATVADHRDKEAVVFATRARAALNAEQAATRLEQGDRASARALLRTNETMFKGLQDFAGAAAVADDLSATGEQLRGLDRAQSESDVRMYKKAVNAKARRDYGLLGSTYELAH